MSRLRNLGKLRSLISGILIGALAVVVAGDCADAQPRELAIGEQPGVVPNPRDEQLSAAYQRQAVFYRTNEPLGTIIVDVVYRYLYFVSESGRAIRYGIGVGRAGSSGKGCCASAARRNGRIGRHRRTCSGGSRSCRDPCEAVPAIRLARARCISARTT